MRVSGAVPEGPGAGADVDRRGPGARDGSAAHGLVYALGILVSFWAIVAVLLVPARGRAAMRAGASSCSRRCFSRCWRAFLFFFALSLAGQFDIGLSLTSVGGALAQKQGYAGSFFTGVLATVVATPCTAPLMGAAVGFALAQTGGSHVCGVHGAGAGAGGCRICC